VHTQQLLWLAPAHPVASCNAFFVSVSLAFDVCPGLDAKFDNLQLIPAADGFDAHSAQKDKLHLPNIKASKQPRAQAQQQP
jgi:hypothetical protein